APTGGIIGIAASLSGIYYRYGGTTTAGFDCSGFTSYVYRQVGKSIPRTAEAQRSASSKVSNPVPGDLIFFGYPAYHVGIFAGAGKMYDSPRTGQTTGLHVIWTQSNVSYGRF
ncbi:MAG TPA: C40 family peptidase, partial [Lapillicoccus sp.]|nr:C40 family peptidase [Lapillicoccus sp.]